MLGTINLVYMNTTTFYVCINFQSETFVERCARGSSSRLKTWQTTTTSPIGVGARGGGVGWSEARV